ncbi:hypothetical protein GCM10022206_82240 [Streptomyces chiangmaiensis]
MAQRGSDARRSRAYSQPPPCGRAVYLVSTPCIATACQGALTGVAHGDGQAGDVIVAAVPESADEERGLPCHAAEVR